MLVPKANEELLALLHDVDGVYGDVGDPCTIVSNLGVRLMGDGKGWLDRYHEAKTAHEAQEAPESTEPKKSKEPEKSKKSKEPERSAGHSRA